VNLVAIPVLLFTVVLILGFLIVTGVFAEPIVALVRRRVPNFSYEGETFLLWGLLLLTTFGLGLVVMYLLLRP
jgi:hypothetical protein